MPVSKGGELHVYHDQVVRAMHDVSILPQIKHRYRIMCAGTWKHTTHRASLDSVLL